MEPTPADPAGRNESPLGAEIELLRQYIQRFADAGAETRDLEKLARVARSLGRACSDLANLLKAETALASRPGGDDQVLRQILEKLQAEMEADGSGSVLTPGLD